jgi:5-methylcytosine-specific restriction endonuclease McrA
MKDKILQLKIDGNSDVEIAKILGCHYMTVRYHLYPKVKEQNRILKKNARRKFMKEMRLALGGKCSHCGYNDCLEALHFHHVDPQTKKLQMSDCIFDKGRDEIKKCVLLCANCHIKEHLQEE